MQTISSPPAAAPRKSRRRWYILGFLLLVAATPVAWYFIAGWLAERAMAELLAEMDADDPGWRWADIVGKLEPIADGENSVTQISRADKLLRAPWVFNPGPKWEHEWLAPNARLTDEQVEAVTIAFGRCDPALRVEARKLKDMPRGRFAVPLEGRWFESEFVETTQKSRAVVYILQIDASLRAHEGDLDGAAESCQAILNVTGAFKDSPLLVGYLVRAAEHAIAVGTIERVLAQGSASEPQLKKLQELLQREADDDGLYAAMRGERGTMHEMYLDIQAGKTTLSKASGGADKGGLTDQILDRFPNFILKDYPDFLRLMNERVRLCKLEPGPRHEALLKIDAEVRTHGNLLSRTLFPAAAKVSHLSLRTQAFMRCTIAGVAVERYRLSHGAWPRTLDDLVKDGLLASVPTDPYDGKPLRWTRTPTGAMVYSVGRDKIDNGGNWTRTNIMADGVDFGFELWDSPKMRGVPPPVEVK